ncbi:hypothetical protein PHYPO_G00250720 [Pangasianodon hypophthalmus]|uniref:Uncharacterized protein n=1 Tax=Pangasianodon hypophthalmus TaxID=310915 RepID=A0A5N5IVR1_PANHP|nr:hypothetical protein PHYPO_G00250720 [Pangasianodon hypophthalmus]
MYSSTGTTAPPTDQALSVKVRAPPPATSVSSLCDERQNELQYYIAKLLERSPGEPLEEHQVDQSKNRPESQPANSGVSSQVELKLEQLADHLHLTLPRHTPRSNCSSSLTALLGRERWVLTRSERTWTADLHSTTGRSSVSLWLAPRRTRPLEGAGLDPKVKGQGRKSTPGDE